LRLEGSAAGERELLGALEAEGVVATPGSLFYSIRAPGLALRLSISALNGEQIEEGVRRLGRALRRLYRP
jgi:DNA-binding transcriptional MocR family regulator